jgi:hypothetical protein
MKDTVTSAWNFCRSTSGSSTLSRSARIWIKVRHSSRPPTASVKPKAATGLLA